jgi:hypothetical protein
MGYRRIHSMGAVTIRRITDRTIGRFMVMDRITGTVIGAIVAGEVIGAIEVGGAIGTTEAGEAIGTIEAREAIGTAEATEDGMVDTKKSGKIPPRGNEMNPG